MIRTLFVAFAFLLSMLPPGSAHAGVSDYVISADDAKAMMGQPKVVFWFAGTEEAFEAGHIPGSVAAFSHDMQYLDDTQKCDGLPMCPDTAAAFVGALGIDNDTMVIAYEDGKGVNESGVWFFLKLYGHDNVKIMEGGTSDWKAKGYPLETGKVQAPAKATFTASPRTDMIATAAQVEAATKDAGIMILDARHTFEEYTGQTLKDGMKNATEHVTVARGGHVPTAIFSPWTKYAGNKAGVAGKPVFRTEASLKKSLLKLEKKGYTADSELITYCHVGLGRGSFQYMALTLAGVKNVKLYVGSWSEWGNSSLPVATK